MASGSGAQFGKIVRPVQGAGLLAERGSESRGRPPRQVSPLSWSFLWPNGRTGGGGGGRKSVVVKEGEEKLIPRICSGEAKNDWVWQCPLT